MFLTFFKNFNNVSDLFKNFNNVSKKIILKHYICSGRKDSTAVEMKETTHVNGTTALHNGNGQM